MKKIIGIVFALLLVLSVSAVAYAWDCGNHTNFLEKDNELSVPATCTTDGLSVYVCKNSHTTTGGEVEFCSFKDMRKDPALDHSWDTGTITKQPTYREKGVKTFKCTRSGCNEEKHEDIPFLTVEYVVIVPGSMTLKIDETSEWSAEVLPKAEDAPEVTWTSSDPTVATVTNGVVTGVKEGNTTITASAEGKSSEPKTVTIVKADTPVGDKYTITTGVYVINAGSGAGSNPGTVFGGGKYEPGERASLTVEENPSYTFMGWEVDGVPKEPIQPLGLDVTKDINVIARFLKNGPISYKVKYCPDSYTIETDSPEDTKTENESLQLRGVTYHRNGYVQVGWLSSSDGNAYDLDAIYNKNSNITLYPKWAVAGEHTLTVYYNADCGNIKTGETLVKNGGTFKIKDDGSATFHFTAIPDYYTGSVVLNGVKQNFKDDTFTVPGRGADQTLKVTFYSRFGNPATGDDSHLLLWSVLGGVSLAAVTTGMVLKKKSKS